MKSIDQLNSDKRHTVIKISLTLLNSDPVE